MRNRSHRPICLADNGKDGVTYKHQERISDISLHYFGCLRASERAAFFARLPKKSQNQIADEARRIERLRSLFEASTNGETRTMIKGFKEGAREWFRHDRKVETNGYQDENELLDMDEDVKAGIIVLENGRPCNIPGLDSEFPSQNISVKKLLSDDPYVNPLMKPCEGNTIRHFHLPANNMIWVEVSV